MSDPTRPDRAPLPAGLQAALSLTGLMLLAALLRAWEIGRDGLWADEAQTARWSSLSARALLDALQAEHQAPLYHAIVAVLARLRDPSEAWLRMPSAVLGVVTVGLVFALAHRLVGRRGAWVAALLLATSPIHVHYSREARGYALLAACFCLALLAARWLHDRPGPASATGTGLALLALLLSHGLAPAYAAGVLAGAIPGAIRGREAAARRRAWVLAGLVAGAGFFPWFLVLRTQVSNAAQMYVWHQDAWNAEWPWQILRSLAAVGHAAPPAIRSEVRFLPLTAWLMVPLVIALALAAWRWRARLRVPDAALVLASALIVPLIVMFLAACWMGPIYTVGRVDSAIAVPMAVLIAAGLCAVPARLAPVASLALVVAAVPALVAEVRVDTRSQERMIATDLATLMRPGDELVVTGPFRDTFAWYLGRSRADVAVRAFPPERELHPFWVDWDAYQGGRMESTADDFARAMAARLPPSGSAWVLFGSTPADDPLLTALGHALAPSDLYDARHLGLRLARFTAREAGGGR